MKKIAALLASLIGFSVFLTACDLAGTGGTGTTTTPGTTTAPTESPATAPAESPSPSPTNSP